MIFKEKPRIEPGYDATKVTLVVDRKDAHKAFNLFCEVEPNTDYDIEIKKHSKRSINANNYHWTLCEQMARVLRTSRFEVHNQLMIDYGIDWVDGNGKRSFVLMKDDDSYMRMQTTHYRPTDATEDRKGTIYRWFILLKPSHLMTTKEMSVLIDGTVSEAKELDIETRTPDEIARMKQLWDTKA